MKRAVIILVAAMLAMLLTEATASAAVTDDVVYISVGDSAAAGVQPPGWAALGYADQLALRMRSRHPRLRLVKLGCPGETTQTLRSGTGSLCDYPAGSQLKQAVQLLRANRGRVGFVTVNVGVNDILDVCLNWNTLALDRACVTRQLESTLANLHAIVTTLRDAAPGTPIAGMSYWDPFLGLWTFDADGKSLARENNKAMQSLNAGLTQTYREAGALVADPAGPAYFNIADFRPAPGQLGGTPRNVANACRWTWFCRPPPFGPDPHPTTSGYRVVADAFAAVLGL